MVTTDLAHREELDEFDRIMDSRGQLASSLGGKLVDLRRVSLGLYREAELRRLGLGGAVSQDPVQVHRQGQKALRRIRQPDLELQAPRWMTVTIETDSLITGLGGDVQALGKSLVEVRKQRRRVEKAASIRRRAEEELRSPLHRLEEESWTFPLPPRGVSLSARSSPRLCPAPLWRPSPVSTTS